MTLHTWGRRWLTLCAALVATEIVVGIADTLRVLREERARRGEA